LDHTVGTAAGHHNGTAAASAAGVSIAINTCVCTFLSKYNLRLLHDLIVCSKSLSGTLTAIVVVAVSIYGQKSSEATVSDVIVSNIPASFVFASLFGIILYALFRYVEHTASVNESSATLDLNDVVSSESRVVILYIGWF